MIYVQKMVNSSLATLYFGLNTQEAIIDESAEPRSPWAARIQDIAKVKTKQWIN